MSVRECAHCKRPMNADLSMCPWCGRAAAAEPPPDIPCPFCHEPISPDAIACRWCGESLRTQPASPGAYAPRPAPAPRPAAPPVQAPDGTAPLVVGILGLIVCQLLAPLAWYLSRQHEAKCRALGVEQDGMGKAGMVLGIIGTVILVAGFCCIGTQIGMVTSLGRRGW